MHIEKPYSALLDLLDHLDAGGVFYRLRYTRPRMIVVDIDLPDGRWEVGFEEDGYVDVEKFVTREGVGGDILFSELMADVDECVAERRGDSGQQ